MLNSQYIRNLTDLRMDPAKVTDLATSSDNPIYIFNRSKPVSVLLNVRQYEELVEKLEDALDALEMKEFEKKPSKNDVWIKHKDILQKLKSDK